MVEGDLVVAALVAVNASGSIDDGTAQRRRSTCRRSAGRPSTTARPQPGANTTIGVIATNARLDKVGCHLVAEGGHDGLARAVFPPHTTGDGDALVAAATGQVDAPVDLVRAMALLAVERAVRQVAGDGAGQVPPPATVGRPPSSITGCRPPWTSWPSRPAPAPAARWPPGARRSCSAWATPHADLLFVGEGPGAEEDRQGLPFVGRSGQLLDRLMLEELGITRERVYIANVVKCRPPDNRDPMPAEIDACRPYLERQIELIGPKVVVTLGKFAGQLLLDSKVGITKLRGQQYPFGDAVLIPTLHPAYALRGGGEPLAQMRADFVRAKLALAAAA